MRQRQHEERTRSRSVVVCALCFLAAALAVAQDAERGRCLPEVELHLDACQSGTQDVWRYTYQGRNDRQMQRSWPYKSRERAQRAMEADQKLCQTVDRYFDHTDCQTSYGSVFCAACESKNPGQEWLSADVKQSLFREIEYWDRVVRQAARAIQKIENDRTPTQNRFGGVFREYISQLKDARARVRAIESLLGHTTQQMDELSRMITALDSQIRAAEGSGRQVEAISVHEAHPPSEVQPGGGAEPPIVTLTAQCTSRLPSWTPVCDQAVDAVFAAARGASAAEIACLKEWRAYHNCIGVYAHDSNPNPRPSCTPPSCRPR